MPPAVARLDSEAGGRVRVNVQTFILDKLDTVPRGEIIASGARKRREMVFQDHGPDSPNRCAPPQWRY
jgi:hypothetical protein